MCVCVCGGGGGGGGQGVDRGGRERNKHTEKDTKGLTGRHPHTEKDGLRVGERLGESETNRVDVLM